MARFFIMNVKAGDACDPMEGPVVAEAQLKDEQSREFFISLAEADGLPNFFMTQSSTYEEQLCYDNMDDELIELLEESYFAGGAYEDVFRKKDPMWIDVFRYLTYLVRCRPEEEGTFIEATKGCWTDEIVIPLTDVEACA